MIRVFLPHNKWEAWQAGQFSLSFKSHDVDASKELLIEPALLKELMQETIETWPNSSLHNMSNEDQNRQAWLGQAACCLHHGAPADATKAAWRELTTDQQDAANAVADEVITRWDNEHNAQALF